LLNLAALVLLVAAAELVPPVWLQLELYLDHWFGSSSPRRPVGSRHQFP
jgi:hypothetical protein